MSQAADFVRDGRLPDIEYRTDAPEEIVCPRVTHRDGMNVVYLHNERDADHQGFVPVADFLQRLARREPGLSATGYRANGRQTTISFNKAGRVTLSARLQSYLASLRTGRVFDEEAQALLDSFNAADNAHFVDWLPRYRDTLARVADALAGNRPEELFELIWKSQDNAVSNAGQGVMGFEAADRLRDKLVDVISDIAADGSAAAFDAIIGRFEQWRANGELASVPRLLVARAFAAIHPDRFHTTVDAAKQDRIIPWFEEHTGLVVPAGNWAAKAEALVAHLQRSGEFNDDRERRNMFPWFVFQQVRDAGGRIPFRPGHKSRAPSGLVKSPEQQREINYRQNLIQDRLVALLRAKHGPDAVGTEHATGTGGFADALVQHKDGSRELYEIKPAGSAREAVRQALGQLLEYAYRRNGLQPKAMHVVSDAPMDAVTGEYLRTLESRFGLKLMYLQIELEPDQEGVS